MNIDDYINSVVGKPWVNRAEGPDSFDCFGLVLDSFRRLDGIELPVIPGYLDFSSTVAEAVKEQKIKDCWSKVSSAVFAHGTVVVCYHSGKPVHVGRCLCGGVVHSLGNRKGEGIVRFQSHAMIRRLFQEVEYYAFNPTP